MGCNDELEDAVKKFSGPEGENLDLTLGEDKFYDNESCIFRIAFDHACNDMMARTLGVKDNMGGKDFKNDIYDVLEPIMSKYFDEGNDYYEEKDFDQWHHSTCDKVLKKINKHYYTRNYKNKNDKKKPVKYGKAQKIVNMTFKYLYCFFDKESQEKYFKYCHMPIDSYILKWVEDKNNLTKINGLKSKFSCWSNLQFSNPQDQTTIYNSELIYDENGKYTYKTICEMIRKLVKIEFESNITPLQAEFIIWSTMKGENI